VGVSKPVSRPAFILAKLVGHGIGFLVTAVAVPTVVFAVEAALLLPAPFSVPRLVVAAAVVALSMLFYLALTIALGTLFDGRGPVAGIGIGLLLAGLFFKGMLPPAFVLVTPWLLGDLAGGVAADTDITFTWAVPVVATTVMTLVLVLVAVQRFRREEF
jgi:ABC-2 type transport system permease protein